MSGTVPKDVARYLAPSEWKLMFCLRMSDLTTHEREMISIFVQETASDGLIFMDNQVFDLETETVPWDSLISSHVIHYFVLKNAKQ